MAEPRNILIRIMLDVTLILSASVPWLLLKFAVSPFKRGFFCDDKSLMYPYHHSTISTTLAISLSLAVPVITFISVESLRYYCESEKFGTQKLIVKRGSTIDVHPSLVYTYWTFVTFIFGASVCESLTFIAKYTVGRLRPHFFDVCKPDRSLINCTDQYGYPRYVTEDVCTVRADDNARLSFPSGHACLTTYAAVFIMIYLQERMTHKCCDLTRCFLQTIVFIMSFYTSLTRISDNMHHWSDVLFGAGLGALVAYLMWRFGGENFESTSSVFTQGDRAQVDDDIVLSTDPLMPKPSRIRAQLPSYSSMQLRK